MRIDATGFVGAHSGSVASANAILVRGLLERQHQIRFFTKPSFVDPRKIALTTPDSAYLEVVDCTNHYSDCIRKNTSSLPIVNRITGWADVAIYNRRLVKQMNRLNAQKPQAHLQVWFGDFVRGGIPHVGSIGYLQGPPGTDARSIFRHRKLITRLAGYATYMKLRVYSIWRMGLGHPDLSLSDHLIVGSRWAKCDLIDKAGVESARVHILPYPVDLKQFYPIAEPRGKAGRLRLLWLGRFVPRKRLDLFLDGLALAVDCGCDVEALIIGGSGFVPGYERLIHEFPYPDRIKHLTSISRDQVPAVLSDVDVLAQPSDDENFGSSVAEALACGKPCIVGATNGTRDYICDRSTVLASDDPQSMAEAIATYVQLKKQGELQDRSRSRIVATEHFEENVVLDKLESILSNIAGLSISTNPSASNT